jgi:multidrug efflux system membrane fusion protein
MIAIQLVSAQIGRVTGKGIIANVKDFAPRWLVISLLLLGGGSLAYVYAPALLLSPGPPAASRPAAGIPVIAGEVRRADVPIFLTGLGTVQALNSVLVKSRVDGQIKKINFSEGQDVRAGDVLVEIDPEPYQAALNQAGRTSRKALLETRAST